MKVKGTGSWFMHEEYVKENYYARFYKVGEERANLSADVYL